MSSRRQLEVIPLSAEHHEEVARLEEDSFRHPWSADMVRTELLHPLALAFGARMGEMLVGYALFRRTGPEAELSRIAVGPCHRRQRIGYELLEQALKSIDRADVLETFLEVRTTNAAARSLYSSFGFRPVGVRKNYYPDGTDALVMCRKRPQSADQS